MNRRFEFKKRSQLFMRVDDETFSVAMRICNPDRSPVGRVRLRFRVLPWNKWHRRQSQKRDGQLPNMEQGVWGAFHPNCIAITA